MKYLDISTPAKSNVFALVDDEDFSELSQFKWYMTKTGYVARNRLSPEKGIEYLHRRLMNHPKGLVDHANRDPLDNRRENLRTASRQENAANMRVKARCGLKGVTAHPGGRWRARITVKGRQLCLGLHATAEAAHQAYIKAAKEHFGAFASPGQ